MDTVRIIYRHEPGYGWSFESPDLDGVVGGDETYEDAVKRAESAVRFHLENVAAELSGHAPADVHIEHFVPAGSVTTSPRR